MWRKHPFCKEETLSTDSDSLSVINGVTELERGKPVRQGVQSPSPTQVLPARYCQVFQGLRRSQKCILLQITLKGESMSCQVFTQLKVANTSDLRFVSKLDFWF